MNKKNFKVKLLVICLIGALLTSHMIIAMASSTGEVKTTVSNFSQLYSAMIQAKDGDVIGINGTISIVGEKKNVGYADKHIILKRMNSSSSFNISSEVIFENVTFDGSGIEASNSYISTTGNATFQDVTFINSINLAGNGGAISFDGGVAFLDNCTFEDNSAYEGGHIYVSESSKVTIENSIFKNGHAYYSGGAIKNNAYAQRIMTLRNSIVKDNSSDNYGGGISINGYMVVYDTKIYNNSAINGGADIGSTVFGAFNMYPYNDMAELSRLYEEDGIIPIGWVNDYDFEKGVKIHNVYPETSNSLLKLVYEIPPTEVNLVPSSLGTPGDGKITGLEPGKFYKVTVNDEINYSKSDGSLTTNEAEAEPLTGTEIIGLTNGVTYLVEEYTPPVEEEPEIPDEEEPSDEENPNDENEEDPIDQEEPKDEEPKDEDPKDEEVDEDPDKESDPPTSTTNNITNSNNTTNTTNNTTNNSTTHNSDTRDESSTVNNYSYDHSTHTITENTYLPPSNDGSSEKGGQASASQHQTITIDYGSIADGIKVQEDGKNITINVNVTVEDKEKDQAEPQVVEVMARNTEPIQPDNNITWIELVKICLLFGIFICVFRRPITK